MRYRPEVDGLRAIAVLAVIFYHAGFTIFKGGFIGVDIFFVISGYLITSIIYSEIKSQSFSFANFYARRAGRIIPPLFLVMMASMPFAYLYLLPIHLKEFARSLIYIPVFVSNIFFMRQSGYFDSDVEIKPMIHTWSLAVEEQYYLIFPLLLLVLYKVNRKWVLPLLALFGIGSFLLAQFHFTDVTGSFYLLHTRAWELLLGVCLAIYLSEGNKNTEPDLRVGNVVSITGLIFIFYSIFFITKDDPFPSAYTLIPTLGTAFILYSSSPNGIVNQCLSYNLLVGIGLISYSLYLWHQPLFAFARYINLTEPSVFFFLLLIGVTFFMAYLSWRFVEKPFRQLAKQSKSVIFWFYFVLSFMFVCVGLWVQKEKGFDDRYPDLKNLGVAEVLCKKTENAVCIFDNKAYTAPTFAVFGDSHAIALMPMFQRIAGLNEYAYVYSARHSCPPLLGVHNLKESDTDDGCYLQNKQRLTFIAAHPSIKKVFLVSRWSTYTDGNYQQNSLQFLGSTKADRHNQENSRAAFEVSLRKTVEAYRQLGVKLYFVYDAPVQMVNVSQFSYFVNKKPLSESAREQIIYSKSVQRESHLALQAFSRNEISRLVDGNTVRAIDLDPLFCDRVVCLMGEGSDPYYFDKDHLTPAGANLTASLFIRAINE